MTIDEAIKHHIDMAKMQESRIEKWEKNRDADAEKFHKRLATDHRQLAEWLTELKDLREENKVLTSECDRLIKEKGELLKQHEQIGEYKRVLKSATNVLNMFIPCDEDYNCSECIKQRQNCDYDDNFKWRYADEALKLIGEDGEY